MVEIVVVDVHGAREGEREQKVDARVERISGAREREERARGAALSSRARGVGSRDASEQRRAGERQQWLEQVEAAPQPRGAGRRGDGGGRRWRSRRRRLRRAHAVTFRHQRCGRPPDRALAAGGTSAATRRASEVEAVWLANSASANPPFSIPRCSTWMPRASEPSEKPRAAATLTNCRCASGRAPRAAKAWRPRRRWASAEEDSSAASSLYVA